MIQLEKNKTALKHLTKYRTKEITTSPFNKMPDAAGANHVLLLEQHYLFALSWLIEELGKLKDNGLHIIAVKEALLQTSAAITEEEALQKTYQMLGKQQPKLNELLDKAGNISKVFFKEQNLEHLVMGANAVQ